MVKKLPKNSFRGVRYVAEVLKQYQKRKYPTTKDAKLGARVILQTLKDNRLGVNKTNILKQSRTKRLPKDLFQLPASLLNADYYFNLINYPALISGVAKDIKFISEVSPKQFSEFNGGDNINYETHFADFVNYCNDLKKFAINEKQYDEDWFVKCNPSNNDKNTYKIITCDASGNPVNYGFNPNKPDTRPTDTVITKEIKTETKVQPIVNADLKQDKDFLLQQSKENTAREERKAQELKILYRLYEDKLIDGKEFKKRYDKLTE
jgi:hypothetical protein